MYTQVTSINFCLYIEFSIKIYSRGNRMELNLNYSEWKFPVNLCQIKFAHSYTQYCSWLHSISIVVPNIIRYSPQSCYGPSRDYVRKWLEIFFTLWFQKSKQRFLLCPHVEYRYCCQWILCTIVVKSVWVLFKPFTSREFWFQISDPVDLVLMEWKWFAWL